MPIYTFKNKESGEVFDKLMPWKDVEAFLQEFPDVEKIITEAPAFCYRATAKMDHGFREVLQKISAETPGSQLDQVSSQL